MHGLVRGFEETGDAEILRAAEKAADWLTTVADGEKRWTRNTHNGIPHVYNTRSAWALLRLHKHRPTAEREAVGRANLDWALSQERNGYYEQNAFEVGIAPFTHTIAYAIRGLLESGWLMGDDRYVKAAEDSARRVSENLRSDGFLAGTIDVQGRPTRHLLLPHGEQPDGDHLGAPLQREPRRAVSPLGRERAPLREELAGHHDVQPRRAGGDQGLATGLGRLLADDVSQLGDQVLPRRHAALPRLEGLEVSQMS